MPRNSRKPIKDLLCRETEKPVLENLYVEYAVPSDQLRRMPSVLRAIVGTFNRITSRDLDEGTILRYIFNRRKDQDWPTLGKRAKVFRPAATLVPPEHVPVLKKIYEALDETSDEILFDGSVSREIARRFREETGIYVAGSKLVAFVFAKRKRGDWLTIREDVAFGDIDDVAV